MNRVKRRLCAGGFFLFAAGICLTGCTSKAERLEKEEAYRQIGINAMEEGDYASAMEAFNRALTQAKGIGANEVDICLYKAAAQFASGSYAAAIETYDALLEYDKKNSDVYFLRGCVYLSSNESDQAQEDFDRAVKYAQDDEIYLEIYHSLKGAGYESEANGYLEQALNKKTGRQASSYTVKGRIYLLQGQYDKAIERLTTAADKGDAEANLYLAQAYEAQGDADQASACIDAYVEVYPESSVAYNVRGRKEMEAGRYEQAIEYFSKGLELDEVTNEQELRGNRIAAYEYNGDFETAEAEMKSYLEDYPEDAAAAREYLFLNKNRNEDAE